jgi:hypothetical protein
MYTGKIYLSYIVDYLHVSVAITTIFHILLVLFLSLYIWLYVLYASV